MFRMNQSKLGMCGVFGPVLSDFERLSNLPIMKCDRLNSLKI